jgi:serine/threonine protein phosphatase PrpC
MGGHAAGEVASKEAIQTLYATYYNDGAADPSRSLRRAVKQANTRILARAASDQGKQGMGTTLVAAVIRDNRLIVANVGDSRAYLFRDGELRQITRDHSWVAEALAAGLITEEQARTHAYRNLITRALGQRPEVKVDLIQERLRPGDLLLLCSDGLTNEVDDARIAHVLSQGSPVESVRSLVILANRGGGRDNISAVVARVPSGRERLQAVPKPALVLGIVTLVAAAVLAFSLWSLVPLGRGCETGVRKSLGTATTTVMPTLPVSIGGSIPWHGGWTSMVPGSDMGQTFTAITPEISVVEIEIMTKGNYASGSDELTMRLQDEHGMVLAAVSQTAPWGFDGWLHFELPHGGLEVQPGQELVIRMEDTKAMFGWKYGPDTNPGGVAIRRGIEELNSDFHFRVIP